MKRTLAIIFVLFTGIVFAEDPVLNVQGVLRDADGAAVPDGENYQLDFYIYDTESGESAIWNESHTGVSIINGVYSVALGEVSTLKGLAFDKPYYLGIAVNGGAESTPRIPLSLSPYALSVRGTTNVFPNDGYVGIGTVDPAYQLEVAGETRLNNYWNFENTNELNTDGAMYLNYSSSNDISLAHGGGKVGIGTITPKAPLDISSYTIGWGGWHYAIRLSDPNHAAIYYPKSGLLLGFHGNRKIYFGDTQDGKYLMTVDGESGNVDIHSGDLNVNGNIRTNNTAPIIIRSYKVKDVWWWNYDTQVKTSNYSAVIVGFDSGDSDWQEDNTGHLFKQMMVAIDGTWHIQIGARTHSTVPDWTVHVMFIRKELVSEERKDWGLW